MRLNPRAFIVSIALRRGVVPAMVTTGLEAYRMTEPDLGAVGCDRPALSLGGPSGLSFLTEDSLDPLLFNVKHTP
jgi:hypothetical protein